MNDMDTSSSSAHQVLAMVDATPAQFNSAQQCITFDEDLQEDPFTQALDKVLGLDDHTIGKDEDDVIFDDLSFSEEVFEDMAREEEQKELAKEDEQQAFDLMASESEQESEPTSSSSSSEEKEETSVEDNQSKNSEQDKKAEATVSSRPKKVAKRSATSNKKKSNNKAKKQPEFKLVLPEGVVDMQRPKRCMSAYNFFFKAERTKLLAELPAPGVKPRRSHGKMGFAAMARHISSKWKKITDDEKMEYEQLAAIDGERYENEMFDYKRWKRDNKIDELTKKQKEEFNQQLLEQEESASTPAAEASSSVKDVKKKDAKPSSKSTRAKRASKRASLNTSSTKELTEVTPSTKKQVVALSQAAKRDDSSCDSSLGSSEQEHEETILNKVDFDLLTFSEMLEDTSFVVGESKTNAAKVSDESTAAATETQQEKDESPDDTPDMNVTSSSVLEDAKKKPLDAQELQELKREAKMKAKKEKKKKATNRPAKSLSAYNIFFKTERKKLLESLPAPGVKPRRSHGKMGFAEMAKHIASKWKKITPEDKMYYEHLSALDSERYEREVEACKKQEEAEKMEQEQGHLTPTPSAMMAHGAAAHMMPRGAVPVTPIPQHLPIVQPIYIRQYVPVPAYYHAGPPMYRPGMPQTPPSGSQDPSGGVTSFLRNSLCRR